LTFFVARGMLKAGTMKKKVATLAAILVIGAASILFVLYSDRRPSLILRGYEGSTTNGSRVAQLELRNTTRKIIWLYYCGDDGERPPFIGEPGASDFSGRVRHLWKKVPPSGAQELDFTVFEGEPPRRAGISYYSATMSEWGEFLNGGGRALPISGTWTQKLALRWYWFKRSVKTPKCRQVWCAQPLSFTGR
jgi:hypothetical protein